MPKRYRTAASNFDKQPFLAMDDLAAEAWSGWDAVGRELRRAVDALERTKVVVCVDCYTGLLDSEVLPSLVAGLDPDLVVELSTALKEPDTLEAMLANDLTTDRVFGVLSTFKPVDFYDPNRLAEVRQRVAAAPGVVLVYGVAASIACSPDVLVLADLARWELQKRYRRKEVTNWGADNRGEDPMRMYKRGYFVDWRLLDRHKRTLLPKIDYLLDTVRTGDPSLVTGTAFRTALDRTARRPFRLVPFFDPGPWGGQWMKEICALDPAEENYAWCFDCVPEENSLVYRFGPVTVEVPSLDAVFYRPVALMGDAVHARFGMDFPIRFDLLDTMGGGNLSLQVHPLTEYVQDTFGMHYTQDESYYLLDAEPQGTVFLGLKEGVEPEAFVADLQRAQAGGGALDDTKYANRWPAKKHDHFLIPAGTLHCAGEGCLVLEISATPYHFTFKLWDWGRLGMDGLPRPIHLEHGAANLQWDRTTAWVKDQLINRVTKLGEAGGVIEERTGLHEREFLETRRHWWTTGAVDHDTHGGVNVLNLIDGGTAVVESPTGAFDAFVVHYAETFVVPAAVGAYRIRAVPAFPGEKFGTIKAYVRT